MKRLIWLVIDVVLVIIFAILGRAAHSEMLDFNSIVRTAAPFVAGCLVGWIVLTRSGQTGTTLKNGATNVATTVIIGNIFRSMIGDGTHWSFILVTIGVVTAFLMGWRLVYRKFGPPEPAAKLAPRKHRKKMEQAG